MDKKNQGLLRFLLIWVSIYLFSFAVYYGLNILFPIEFFSMNILGNAYNNYIPMLIKLLIFSIASSIFLYIPQGVLIKTRYSATKIGLWIIASIVISIIFDVGVSALSLNNNYSYSEYWQILSSCANYILLVLFQYLALRKAVYKPQKWFFVIIVNIISWIISIVIRYIIVLIIENSNNNFYQQSTIESIMKMIALVINIIYILIQSVVSGIIMFKFKKIESHGEEVIGLNA